MAKKRADRLKKLHNQARQEEKRVFASSLAKPWQIKPKAKV